MSKPYILREGESIRPLGPLRLLVDGQASGGRLTLYEGMLPPGGPPLHVHDFDEVILVLAGRLIVQLDESVDELKAGDFAWLATGHAHTFANTGHEPTRALGLAMPSGIEHLFAERGEYLDSLPEGRHPNESEMAEIYARHASRVLGPPIEI